MTYDMKKQRIYETPDGGKTVYARLPRIPFNDSPARIKICEDGDTLYWTDFMLRDWDELVERYPAVEDQLKRLKVVLELCNESR